MSTQSAFQRGVHPLLRLLLLGKEEAVLSIAPDKSLHERIETLAAKSTEGNLTAQEQAEMPVTCKPISLSPYYAVRQRPCGLVVPFRDWSDEGLGAAAGQKPL